VGLFSLLFSYNGRINRAQYWLGGFGVFFVGFLLIIALAIGSGANFADAKDNPAAAIGALASFFLWLGLILLVMSWCSLSMQVKRFHDRGQSGWWSLLAYVPSLGATFGIIGSLGGTPEQMAAAIQPYSMLSMVIGLGFFINLGCLPGTQGANKYGDPPGSGGGGHSFTPAPAAPSAPVIPGMGMAKAAATPMGSAQAAMERAIADKTRAPQARAPQQPRPASAPMSPAPAGGAPTSFGRRTR
jgi:uncharacterized membrane protein YhaH (DUF805 family)